MGPPVTWLFLVAGVIPFLAGLFLMLTNPEQDSEVPFYVQMIILFILIIVGFVMFMMKLEYEIRDGKLRYKFWPFILKWKYVDKEQIASWEIKKVNPIFYSGGWGYRRRFWNKKKAFLTRGRTGLELKLNDGTTLFMTCLNPESLKSEMNKWMEEEDYG